MRFGELRNARTQGTSPLILSRLLLGQTVDGAEPLDQCAARDRHDRPVDEAGLEDRERLAIGLDAEDRDEYGLVGDIEIRIARGQTTRSALDATRGRELDDFEGTIVRIAQPMYRSISNPGCFMQTSISPRSNISQ